MEYKEKFKEAKRLYETANADQKYVLESLFPELTESEDEKIRKALKEYFINSFQNNGVAAICGVHIKDILAWLEKQGDKKEDMIQNACEAFCQVRCKGNPPRSTCTSLGTCMEHDDFCKAIKKQGEQKPAEWSKEDKDIWLDIKSLIDSLLSDGGNSDYTTHELQKMWDWLDTIWQKDRVQPQPKQEWNEEDKFHLKSIESTIEYCKREVAENDDARYLFSEDLNWLKSLRPQSQWKPSDEQMNTLEQWLKDNQYKGDVRYCYPIFESLYHDLKKLMEK